MGKLSYMMAWMTTKSAIGRDSVSRQILSLLKTYIIQFGLYKTNCHNKWETPMKYNRKYPKIILTMPVMIPIFAISF